ncbi:MAG: Metallo-peptidase family Reprolysin-like [Nocardioides sp.]|nr:Metallo-peptidase family Reprolysin-like [Nocardioides sp.]
MPRVPPAVLWSTTVLAAVLSVTVPPAPSASAAPAVGAASAAPEPHVWADPPPASGPGTWSPRAARLGSATSGDVLDLHSLPGSRRTVFIDFDGHAVTGTLWNEQGVPSGVSPGWDLSGNGVDVLSATERAAIADVWSRVAEDFAPFDVDVTTADPGRDAITRSGAADQVYGVRVLVTRDAAARAAIDACQAGCGGAAANDVFDTPVGHERFQPAWVFPQALRDDPAYVAEAVSHEVGHTFGLAHDDRAGDADAGYYAGHAGWAPIMGSAYGQPLSQWSRGSYAGATNTEDDLAVIAAHGAPLRPDETGALPGPGRTAYISDDDDVDVYRLRGCVGPVQAEASVAGAGADLDLELRLLRADDRLLATADPVSRASGRTVTGLAATLRHAAPSTPTDYLLAVDGTGRAGSTPTSGYDDYGSVGAYRLAVTGCGIVGGAPGAPGAPTVRLDGTTARLSWTPPASSGGSSLTAYDVLVDGVRRTRVTGLRATLSGLARGRTYDFQVAAVNQQGAGLVSRTTARVAAGRPGAPVLTRATSGGPGGGPTASTWWTPPTDTGGAPVTRYRLTVYRLSLLGRVLDVLDHADVEASVSHALVTLAPGRYRFTVRARNAVGWGPPSARSAPVTAR